MDYKNPHILENLMFGRHFAIYAYAQNVWTKMIFVISLQAKIQSA